MSSNLKKQKSVEDAARAKNPLESILHRSYSSGKGSRYTLYCRIKADMDAKTVKWAYKLAEQNVSPYYKKLVMGWQPKVKQNDHNKKWARYLIALNEEKQPVAYAMFRFDMDYGDSVLYCYEMQIHSDYRRQGLGKFMMHVLEEGARHWHMEKVVLTVLNNNDDALTFFKSIGYTKDSSSPDILENAEYQILSKGTIA